MARDYLVIGSVPAAEDCAQVGTPNYKSQAIKECRAFIEQLRRQFGPEPVGARLERKEFPHDFGSYDEVVVWYDEDNQEAIDYAFKLEAEMPEKWDSQAMLQLFGVPF